LAKYWDLQIYIKEELGSAADILFIRLDLNEKYAEIMDCK